jgi:uncharacterized surface protein with fasciclin (FAS1) repeats
MSDRNRNIVRAAAVALVVGLALAASALAQDAAQQRPGRAQESQPAEPQSIYFTAEGMSDLSIFFRAVKASGLTDTLKGPGPFTVFAPTDEAFARLPAGELEELFRPQNKERLRGILITHIYAARATGAEIVKLNDALTLRRNSLTVEAADGGVKVGGARVTRTDIAASNGVIHLVDTLLVPGGN